MNTLLKLQLQTQIMDPHPQFVQKCKSRIVATTLKHEIETHHENQMSITKNVRRQNASVTSSQIKRNGALPLSLAIHQKHANGELSQ